MPEPPRSVGSVPNSARTAASVVSSIPVCALSLRATQHPPPTTTPSLPTTSRPITARVLSRHRTVIARRIKIIMADIPTTKTPPRRPTLARRPTTPRTRLTLRRDPTTTTHTPRITTIDHQTQTSTQLLMLVAIVSSHPSLPGWSEGANPDHPIRPFQIKGGAT